MASRLLTATSAIVVLLLLGVSFTTLEPAWRVVSAGAGPALAFLLGIGVGERSKSAYCKHILRVNSLLADQLRALSDENLAALGDGSSDCHEASSGPPAGGPHQMELRGHTPR